MKTLHTRPVACQADIRRFFDDIAAEYRECHGAADKLLNERVALIRDLLPPAAAGRLLEIGCGTGIHLFALADGFVEAIGVDLAPGMIARAEQARTQHPCKNRIRFYVDPAETLACIDDAGCDVVLCVGAFEHLWDKAQALRQIHRVLRPGGAFVCLTPNGGYLWYTQLARRLGLSTRHLSSDRFLAEPEWRTLLAESGLLPDRIGYWTFIPRGDMPHTIAVLLTALDGLGRRLAVPEWRGGLYCRAFKPA